MKNLLINLITTPLLLVLIACGGGGGGGGGNDAPYDATMTTSTSSIPATCADDEDPLTDDTFWYTESFVIFVKDKNGIPFRDVDLSIFFPLAVPNANAVQLYDGDPGHGASPKDSPLSASTDENGSYTLYFQFLCGGGVEYKASFQITAGPLSKLLELDVKASTL
jgi:hypothetical protein